MFQCLQFHYNLTTSICFLFFGSFCSAAAGLSSRTRACMWASLLHRSTGRTGCTRQHSEWHGCDCSVFQVRWNQVFTRKDNYLKDEICLPRWAVFTSLLIRNTADPNQMKCQPLKTKLHSTYYLPSVTEGDTQARVSPPGRAHALLWVKPWVQILVPV